MIRGLYAALLIAFLPSVAFAEERQENMKVAFSLRFASFVTWAEEHSKPSLQLCVFGSVETIERFRRIEGELVSGKSISIAPLNNTTAGSCDVAYFSESSSPHSVELLKTLRTRPVLTVGDAPSFIEQGGIIRIYESSNRMRFEISQAAGRQAGLRISSKLLNLAAGHGRDER